MLSDRCRLSHSFLALLGGLVFLDLETLTSSINFSHEGVHFIVKRAGVEAPPRTQAFCKIKDKRT